MNINKHYTIRVVTGSKPKRYIVMLGNIPMSRPMEKHDAEQWLMLQLGELESDSILIGWSGANSRN